MIRTVAAAALMSFLGTAHSAADDLWLDDRVKALAVIQVTAASCGFDVSPERLSAYLSDEGLDTPEALSAIQLNADLSGGNLRRKPDELPIVCVQAETTARAIGILAE